MEFRPNSYGDSDFVIRISDYRPCILFLTKRILVKKPFAVLSLFFCLPILANSQSPGYWQQEVNYTIEVSLNDKDNTLNAFEKIEYVNNSPDTLRYIWFHIWPNAYKNDKTAFSDQLLENGNTKFYFSSKEQKGYVNRLDFKVNNITAELRDHPEHIDIAQLILPSPLPPHQRITITTPFHEKLPYNFSRGGYDGQSYQVTQWYPKPAVYDRNGWHPMPYLDQGEFYSEFGSFDVSITVPENYVVAATGELQNADEKEWLKTRSAFNWEPVRKKIKTKSGSYKTIYDPFPKSSSSIKILRFRQNNVHDFAWFADKRFIVNYDTCHLPSGRVIDVYTYYTPAEKNAWHQSIRFAKNAVLHYSNRVGEYPYNIVSAVQGPASFGGGMEYPTITLISSGTNALDLDFIIAHEIGHNWFYGILASNERSHPWMDEGINSYYEMLYSVTRNDHAPYFDEKESEEELQTLIANRRDQPIETSSEAFTVKNYDAVAYYKASKWVAWMKKYLGEKSFTSAMHEYFRQWQFRHPQPEDLKKVFEDVSGKNLDSAFALLNQEGYLPGQEPRGSGLWNPFETTFFGKNLNEKNVIAVLPSVGYNYYDKFKLGVLITNVRTPPSRFQFLLTPMYAFGSKQFTGTGLLKYDFYTKGYFRKIGIGLNGSTFSMDNFTGDDGSTAFLRVQKIVPNIRLTLKQKYPRSTLNRFVQFKSYLIAEDALRFYRDTVIAPGSPPDTTVTDKFRTIRENRVLNQLQLVIENTRTLYPYRGELKLEQGKDFFRLGFTGNYFFNYAKGSGLDLRLFAGKFFYRGSQTFTKKFNTDRYHLNMTGPNGYEDYTYSDYFIGRNEFEGTISQQVMVRDGAFKVRTELLADKVGKTDDWLIAVNLSTGLPGFKLVPEAFPVKIKFFADVGTYAEPWKKNATSDRFLFDGGIQIAIFKTVNIYFPLVYSKVFKDYIQSILPQKHRLFHVMAFSIDISNFNLKTLNSKFDF
jgi:hypothetical protein